MLLGCQHKDSEDKLGGQEHLDEETLDDRGVTTKRGAYVDLAIMREHARNQSGGGDATKNLHNEQETSTYPWQCANQAHAERDSRVEEPTRDAEENPSIHSQRKSKAESDVL